MLETVFGGLLGEKGVDPDQVLGIYTSTIAPSVISADSPRFLGFIPSAPTKASLLFDMLVSCASIQGISWLEAAGAVHAENQVLRLLADLAGLPPSAGGAFVSGGSAGNLSALAVARETAKERSPGHRHAAGSRVAVGSDAHSSVVNTLRLLELDALVVRTEDHRLTGAALRAAIEEDGDPGSVAPSSPLRARRTPASSTTCPGSPRSPASTAGGSTSTPPTAGPACSHRRSGTSSPASSTPTR